MERAYLEADWRSAASLLERNPFPQDAWRGLFAAVMIEILGVKRDMRSVMKQLSEQMSLIKPARKLIPGAKHFLDYCRQHNIKLGLLSNNDGRTREKCRDVEIEDYFDDILDSTVEGLIKPNPGFFRLALERIGVGASDVLHVGDLLGCDVLGAQKAGIKAAWYHRRKYMPNAVGINPDYTVHHFEEIEALLGGR
jgi:HAD superfamily hydrolase (TIGR01549 family)